MIEIRIARSDERGAQTALWQAAFGDTRAYIDLFYRNCTSAIPVVAMEDGVLQAMCFLLPVTHRRPGLPPQSVAYLYALATAPEARGQGIAHRLLAWVDDHLTAAGYDGVCTVPATCELHSFFASAGYSEAFVHNRILVEACDLPPCDPGDTMASIPPAVYDSLRGLLLSGTSHVTYDTNFLRHQGAVSCNAGGGLFQLQVGAAFGVAAAEYNGDCLVVKELLMPQEELLRCAALLNASLPAARLELRVPPGTEGTPYPFGMSKGYGANEPASGYFAFALD